MNKKGEGGFGDLLFSDVAYLILVIVFFVAMLVFVRGQRDGAEVWADYYAKEIVKVVDLADAGDEACLDVHKATGIAGKNGVGFSEIFNFNNLENEVCVKLSRGRNTCFSYFNEVDVVNVDLKITEGLNEEGEEVNLLCFEIEDVDVVEVDIDVN